MTKLLTTVSLLLCMTATAMAQTANCPWQNNNVLQINREPARAGFIPYNRQPGDMSISLNGEWDFRWAPTPEDIDKAEWGRLMVPANWEVNGYGTPIYSSSGYTFKVRPPFVMDEPKAGYTTVKERNPTGQYRRKVSIPKEWLTDGGRTYIRFDGVMSAFSVKVNGRDIGYSQGSNHPAEFLLIENGKWKMNNCADELEPNGHSPFSILHSPLEIEVLVHKYSDGSYLEDQDAWRFGGIHRDVTLYHTPALRLRDFTVRTIATDDTYRNFRLQVHPLLQSLDGSDGADTKVVARLYDADGKELTTMEAPAQEILNINHKAGVMNEWYPQRGHMKFERMGATISDVKPWTAETPYLYTLVMCLVRNDAVIEQATQKVGFRQLEIKDGMFLVNGRQVRFRGVNRVEHDPYTAHAMTYDRLLQDVTLMKAANINAIRTAHAPAHPLLYDICDSLGMYILDEADCENHGVRGEFTSTPDWNAAMMDRVIRLAERDKNHPCVVFWSLGNESGYGANHAAMAGWLHEFDPTRFVHYEGAQAELVSEKRKVKSEKSDAQPTAVASGSLASLETRAPDPACVDVISRFYPRVQQEYLNPGIPEGSDKERAENARWEFLLSIAQSKQYFRGGYMDGILDTRPVLTSEYAHCMGNALGNFQEYWDEIYSNPRMLGGFVWDWVDQGIIPTLPSIPLPLGRGGTNVPFAENKSHLSPSITGGGSGGGSVLYGGDFGDKPNLKAFCLNGIVKCDRGLTSKYYEVQHVYSPVQFARHGDDIYVVNRSSHLPLTNYHAVTELKCNGMVRKQKDNVLAMPDIAYGDSAVIARVSEYVFLDNQDVRLNIYVTNKTTKQKVMDEQISIAGNVLNYAQALLANEKKKVKSEKYDSQPTAVANSSLFTLHSSLASNARASFYRAPTDNDKSFGNWLAKDWTKNRIDSPTVKRISTREEGAATVTVDEYTFDNGTENMGGKIVVTTRLTPVDKNAVDVVVDYECVGDMPEPPRMGIALKLPKEYERLQYYGRGPYDNYPDRWRSSHVGLWESTVTDEYDHYPVPQDCGNHGETVSVTLKTAKGKTIRVNAVEDAEADNNGAFSFSALHYTPQDIAAVRHDYELQEGDYTILTINCAVLGIGNSSCGPGVLKKYSIDKSRKHRLHVVVRQ